jgi:uncharacterized protein YaeQ
MQIELSDISRSVYESLSLTVARHASEDESRLVARVLAYCLCYEDGLEFGRGLSDVDEPALWLRDPGGDVLHWIDVGQPAVKRLHRASKRAGRVTVVCHRGAPQLAREAQSGTVHRAEALQVILLPDPLVAQIVAAIERNSSWTFIRTDDELQITVGDERICEAIESTTLADLATRTGLR